MTIALTFFFFFLGSTTERHAVSRNKANHNNIDTWYNSLPCCMVTSTYYFIFVAYIFPIQYVKGQLL